MDDADKQKRPSQLGLFKQSYQILKSDKQFVLFPVLSGVFAGIAAMIVGGIYLAGINTVIPQEGVAFSIFSVVMLFLYYLSAYYILIYFNSGLAASVLSSFKGGETGYKYGMSQAKQKRKQILEYAIVAAIVGVLLKLIAEKLKFLGTVVEAVLGAAWSLATVFIAPVIITSDLGPIDAIKESAGIFKKTWGKTIVGSVGFALIGLVAFVACLIPIGAGIFLKDTTAIIVGGAITVVGFVIASILINACASIYRTALFYYATTKSVPKGYDSNLPASVRAKKQPA